jgi:predicted dehydrogenase
MRYAPAMIQLQNLVASGAIGAPRLLQMFLQNGQFLDPAAPFHWKMDRDRAGGGAIVEYGIHGLDLARWVMGEATRVCATGRTWVAERQLADATGSARVNVDDSTAWLMEFASGAIGVCHAGWATVGRPPGLEFRVFGDQGAISCTLWDDLPGSQRLDIAGADGHFRPAKIQLALALPGEADAPWWRAWPAALIRHFVDEIQSTTNVSPTFDDGVRAQGLLDAIVRSMREGRWMVVPL